METKYCRTQEHHMVKDSYTEGYQNPGFNNSSENFRDFTNCNGYIKKSDCGNSEQNEGQHRSPNLSIRSFDSSIIVDSEDSDIDTDGKDERLTGEALSKPLTLNGINKFNNNANILEIDKDAKLMNEKIVLNKTLNNSTNVISPKFIVNDLMQNLVSNTAQHNKQQQHIGSIAITNSSDITFGNKHFYEGPVTIQQFLIKNVPVEPVKHDNDNNNNNDVYHNITAPAATDQSKRKLHESLDKISSKTFDDIICLRLNLSSKLFISGIVCMLIVLILLAVMGLLTPTSNLNLIEPCLYSSTHMCLVKRHQWNAKHIPLGSFVSLHLPVERVIIAHTVTEMCLNFKDCVKQVQLIQDFHINEMGFSHIGYNFLIGSDGRVYEGRGWNMVGAHTKGANNNSFGVAFIGTFIDDIPNELQLNAFKLWCEESVRLNKLVEMYKIFGARQFTPTQSPGDALYELMQTWQHWHNTTTIK